MALGGGWYVKPGEGVKKSDPKYDDKKSSDNKLPPSDLKPVPSKLPSPSGGGGSSSGGSSDSRSSGGSSSGMKYYSRKSSRSSSKNTKSSKTEVKIGTAEVATGSGQIYVAVEGGYVPKDVYEKAVKEHDGGSSSSKSSSGIIGSDAGLRVIASKKSSTTQARQKRAKSSSSSKTEVKIGTAEVATGSGQIYVAVEGGYVPKDVYEKAVKEYENRSLKERMASKTRESKEIEQIKQKLSQMKIPPDKQAEIIRALEEGKEVEIAEVSLPDISRPENVLGRIPPERKTPKIEHFFRSTESKILELASKYEIKGATSNSISERLKAGAVLAGLGIGAGALNVAQGVYGIGQQAASGDIKGAAKTAVTGAVEWVKSIPSTLKAAYTESPYYAGKFSGEVVGGVVLSRGVGVATRPLPKPAYAQVSAIVSKGAKTKTAPVRYGVAIQALNKPLITITRSGNKLVVRRGAVAAPLPKIEGKTITATTKLETEFFRKTVKSLAEKPEYAELFETGYQLTKRIYKTKEPVVKPKRFEILSENIPRPAREAIVDVLKKERGVEVYGSLPQKLQMGEWMTRTPQDIEIVVKSPEKFVSRLETKLRERGVEYRIEGGREKPKVYFKIGSEWVKGVEIFGKDFLDAESYFKYGLGLYSGRKTAIAYGFEKQKPIKIEKIPSLRLSEQAARKLEGGHVFTDRKILPKHEGRFKDVRDLIEIATAYAVEKKLPIEKDVIRYTELAKKLYGEKVETPIAEFIAKHKRLPTIDELKTLAKEVVDTGEKELLYERPTLRESIRRDASSSLYVGTRGSAFSGVMRGYSLKSSGGVESSIFSIKTSSAYSARITTKGKISDSIVSDIKRKLTGDSGISVSGRQRIEELSRIRIDRRGSSTPRIFEEGSGFSGVGIVSVKPSPLKIGERSDVGGGGGSSRGNSGVGSSRGDSSLGNKIVSTTLSPSVGAILKTTRTKRSINRKPSLAPKFEMNLPGLADWLAVTVTQGKFGLKTKALIEVGTKEYEKYTKKASRLGLGVTHPTKALEKYLKKRGGGVWTKKG